jgi:nucleotide sugar dehydrogenase
VKAGVIGLGTVGRAQVRMLAGHDVVAYDPAFSGSYPFSQLAACDLAIICVDTPSRPSGRTDLAHFWDAVDSLPVRVPLLIRSTVPPGTTDRVLLERPQPRTAHAPEFLHEREGGPWRDPGDVPFMILGGDARAREYFRPLLAKVYPGVIHECDAVTAELAKYVANCYWAARVTFVNQMGAVAAAAGADWEAVRGAWLADERVSPAYTSLAGFPPGFGGRCWPKDLAAITCWAAEHGADPVFLEAITAANEQFRTP